MEIHTTADAEETTAFLGVFQICLLTKQRLQADQVLTLETCKN